MPLPLLPTTELDLARLDSKSLLTRSQTLAYQAIPSWTDFSPNYPENVILEWQALLGGMIGGVINERARQATQALVTDRLAMIRMARPYGYTLSGATAAQVSGTFSLPNGALATKAITLLAGTRVQTGNNIFQLTSDNVLLLGSNATGLVTLEHAESDSESFTSSDEANQRIQLTPTDIIVDSDDYPGHFRVTAGDGIYRDHLGDTDDASAPLLTSFLEAGPDDKVFIAMITNNGRAYIMFGDSIHGKVPQGTITVDYKIGGGLDGRVGANATWQVLDQVYYEDGTPVSSLNFNNAAASVGGFDRTSVDEARVRAPLARRTIERCVIEEDFEYAATRVSGVARAAFITSNQDGTVAEDEGHLYVVAYGSPYGAHGYYPPAYPTSDQLASVRTLIAQATGVYKQLMGVDVTVLSAVLTSVEVSARVYKASGYTTTQVRSNVSTALQKFFAVADDNRAPNPDVDFGYKLLGADGSADYELSWSDVFNAINDAEGVRKVSYATDNLLLNGLHQSVVLSAAAFPLLSTITLYDMDNSGVQF